ncbi:TAXI family TRAP transporter solute-binding subunit [Salipiger sp. H15]|uniref:TAXI family TRAP transporter solute-binding subunit n=1 Tax=Alloyangia sp. H15 TaxID=3029062 RepID=UPI0033650895
MDDFPEGSELDDVNDLSQDHRDRPATDLLPHRHRRRGRHPFPIGGSIINAIRAPPGSRPCAGGGGNAACWGRPPPSQSTTASVFNAAALQNGKLEAGLVAADIVHDACHGVPTFEGKVHDRLRVAANLCPENLHLVMPAGATIENRAGLGAKRDGIAALGVPLHPGAERRYRDVVMLK